MSHYLTMLNEAIVRLKGTPEKPAMTALGVEVTPLQQFQGEFKQLQPQQKARVTVSYLNTRYGADQMGSNENDTQVYVGQPGMARAVYFTLTVSSRELYTPTGAVVLSEFAERLILGLKPSCGGEFYAFSNDILVNKDNTWHVQVVCRVKNFMLTPLEYSIPEWEEYLGGILKQVDFIEQTDENHA